MSNRKKPPVNPLVQVMRAAQNYVGQHPCKVGHPVSEVQDRAKRTDSGHCDYCEQQMTLYEALAESVGKALATPVPSLSFAQLREANIKRLPLFKNRQGKLAHSEPDGSDWSPAQWLQAVVGELGEYANIRKKFERGDFAELEFSLHAAEELADIVIYLDILAYRLGIPLGDAITVKFNAVSDRVGCEVKL